MVLPLAACIGLDSEDKLSFERWEDRPGVGLGVDAAGRRGWRKATAAVIVPVLKLAKLKAQTPGIVFLVSVQLQSHKEVREADVGTPIAWSEPFKSG